MLDADVNKPHIKIVTVFQNSSGDKITFSASKQRNIPPYRVSFASLSIPQQYSDFFSASASFQDLHHFLKVTKTRPSLAPDKEKSAKHHLEIEPVPALEKKKKKDDTVASKQTAANHL